MRNLATLSLALPALSYLIGCGAAGVPARPPAATPAAATAEAPKRPAPLELDRAPFTVPLDLRTEPAHLMDLPASELTPAALPAAPASVPAPPKSCALAPRPLRSSCADPAAARAALADALASPAAQQQAELAALEGCAGLPGGFVSALRAELAPAVCADVVAAPALSRPAASIRPLITGALQGHVVAGRLARLPSPPPRLEPPFDKQRVLDHIRGPVARWLVEQSEAVEETSRAAERLTFYGRAVAALEAGMADLRMVEAMRAMPVSDEIARDPELRSVYEGALEESLDPRKARGRDAVLVALGDFAAVGALSDPRVTRARALLAKMYGGRRIDALDALWLPSLPELKAATVEQRLALSLPTFYSAVLLDPAVVSDEATLVALSGRGVPGPARRAMSGRATPEAKRQAAVLRLRFGQTYWRAFDFDEAATLLRDAPHTGEPGLLLALALALRGGPENAAAMMRRAPGKALSLGDPRALEQVAKGTDELAGLAAYDAAVLRELTVAPDAPAAFWDDLAGRYDAAAARITLPAWRARATSAAAAARAIRAALPR
ncbi:MAG: hypothetical protein IT374_07870 [Polyangiaceae bacterium]|nr:hypothetical protein [Polyangiaceae bacterium]